MTAALISASVAVFVFAMTQAITARRERAKLLLSKLEELYSVLSEYGHRVVQRAEQFDREFIQKLPKADLGVSYNAAEWRALDIDSKLEMYVAFYFPSLSDDLQRLFDANKKFYELIEQRFTRELIFDEIISFGKPVGDSVDQFQNRILREKKVLTGSFVGDVIAWFSKASYG